MSAKNIMIFRIIQFIGAGVLYKICETLIIWKSSNLNEEQWQLMPLLMNIICSISLIPMPLITIQRLKKLEEKQNYKSKPHLLAQASHSSIRSQGFSKWIYLSSFVHLFGTTGWIFSKHQGNPIQIRNIRGPTLVVGFAVVSLIFNRKYKIPTYIAFILTITGCILLSNGYLDSMAGLKTQFLFVSNFVQFLAFIFQIIELCFIEQIQKHTQISGTIILGQTGLFSLLYNLILTGLIQLQDMELFGLGVRQIVDFYSENISSFILTFIFFPMIYALQQQYRILILSKQSTISVQIGQCNIQPIIQIIMVSCMFLKVDMLITFVVDVSLLGIILSTLACVLEFVGLQIQVKEQDVNNHNTTLPTN